MLEAAKSAHAQWHSLGQYILNFNTPLQYILQLKQGGENILSESKIESTTCGSELSPN